MNKQGKFTFFCSSFQADTFKIKANYNYLNYEVLYKFLKKKRKALHTNSKLKIEKFDTNIINY